MDVTALIAATRFPRAQVHRRPGPSLGDGTLTLETLDVPAKPQPSTPSSLSIIKRGKGLARLERESWERPLGPTWNPFSEASTLDLALRVLDEEVIHHGAEVGLLGDLWSAGQDDRSGPAEISSQRRGRSSRNGIRGRGTLASASMEP
jgi:hypothetical protein